jgi:hypothetical protein
MNNIHIMAISVFTTLVASSGFWAYLIKRMEKTNSTTRLLLGLAHDRIVYRGTKFIEQGYIDQHDYKDFRTYLYEPYKELGGNSTADRVMNEMMKLPFSKEEITS